MQNLTHGPAFSNGRGEALDPRWLEMEILERFRAIQIWRPDVIQPDVDMYGEFGIPRLLHSGANRSQESKSFRIRH
jgi:hypothetical protein